MNPCPRNRQPLAWLALNSLPAPETAALRAHLEACAGCRRYFVEISSVKETLFAASEVEPPVEVSAAFRQNLTKKLYSRTPASVRGKTSFFSLLFRRQLAAPAVAFLVLMTMIFLNRPYKMPASAAPNSIRPMALSPSTNDPSPTAGNYDFIARQSPDKLDELLNRQGNKPLPPVPTFRASGFVPDNASYSDLLQTDPSK